MSDTTSLHPDATQDRDANRLVVVNTGDGDWRTVYHTQECGRYPVGEHRREVPYWMADERDAWVECFYCRRL